MLDEHGAGWDSLVIAAIQQAFPGPTHRIIYVGSQAAGERVMASTQGWIETRLRLQVNATKSGVGMVWERRFLGFRLNRGMQIEAAPASLERFKAKVREKWRSGQSLTSNQLRDAWRQYLRGWWGYHRLAENRRPIYRLESWIRRHIRKCFWLRWHKPEGRERRLRSLGLRGRMLKVAQSHRGAWHLARTGRLQSALSKATLRRHGFLMPSDLARGLLTRGFNRRMRKTARPVVWEGDGAKSPVTRPDLAGRSCILPFKR